MNERLKGRLLHEADFNKLSFFEFYDLNFGPGCFVGQGVEIEYMGEKVRGLNYLHAIVTWAANKIAAHGGELGVCDYCGHSLRYAVLYINAETGALYNVGQDCAAFIDSDLDRRDFEALKIGNQVREIKRRDGQGVSYVYSIPTPAWFWDVPKGCRPDYVRLNKWERDARDRKGRSLGRKEAVWQLNFWGNTQAEVVANVWEFREYVKAAQPVFDKSLQPYRKEENMPVVTDAPRAYFLPLEAYDEKKGFRVGIATQGVSGYHLTDWYWGHNLDLAKECAMKKNAALGLSDGQAKHIVESSIGASLLRRF